MFPSPTRFLIVDDMAMFRQMLKRSLTELGFDQFSEAGDGGAAFEMLVQAASSAHPYEVVLCDWNMPRMKGIDLLKKVRAESWGMTLPFVMLTAEAEKKNVIEAMQHGVTHYMVKPIAVEALQQKLKQVYEKMNQAPAPSSMIIV